MITIKLLDSIDVISTKVNTSIASYINKKIRSQKANIQKQSKSLATQWISTQPEMVALSSSLLSGEFGLRPGTEAAAYSAIVSSVASSVSVEIVPFNNSLTSGGIKIYFQPSDFVNLLSIPQGYVIYEKGALHWLEWMLKRGDSTIITNYEYNPKTGLGRSGLGNMKPGGFFRVPPQYSGVETDNFVTRALIGIKQEQEIAMILKNALR